MEQVLHILVIDLKDGERDGAHRCLHELLLGVVQRERRVKQWKRLQTIVREEKVYGLVIELENESFEEVDKVVRQFVVLGKREVK